MGLDIKERRYFLVSIKHSQYPKGRTNLVLWGSEGKTADGAKRHFGGYTVNPDSAEVYSVEDVRLSGYGPTIIPAEPVPMSLDLVRRWKKYDSVLVDAELYRQYLQFA